MRHSSMSASALNLSTNCSNSVEFSMWGVVPCNTFSRNHCVVTILIFYWWYCNIEISKPSEHSWLSFSKVHDWVPSKSVCFDAFEIARKSDFFVLVASHWERSLLYLGGEQMRLRGRHFCLIIVEVHPFKPTKDSTFTIWYLESKREFGLREFWQSERNENT